MLEDPLWLHGSVQYDAREFRRLIDVMFSEGVLGSGSFAVTQRGAGANFSVDVTAGLCVIQGDDQSLQGKYLCRSTATENVTIAAAPGSNSRYDLIVARVKDPTAGGAAGDSFVLEAVTGTASASPVVPSTPATAIVLARIGPITSATASITNALILDQRTTAHMQYDLLAPLFVTTSHLADSAVTLPKMADASVGTAELVDDSVTPAKISDYASGSLQSGLLQYARSAGIVHVWTTSSMAVGSTLPVGFRPTTDLVVPAVNTSGSGSVGYVTITTSGSVSVTEGAPVRFNASFLAA